MSTRSFIRQMGIVGHHCTWHARFGPRMIVTGRAKYSHRWAPQKQPGYKSSKPRSVGRFVPSVDIVLTTASARNRERLAGGPGDGNECPWSPHDAAKSAAWMPGVSIRFRWIRAGGRWLHLSGVTTVPSRWAPGCIWLVRRRLRAGGRAGCI